MERSSIYVRCPGCGDTTLVQHRGATYVCAACAFDYGALAKDRPAFERFLVERMREGPMGQLGAIAVHQWVSGLGAAESAMKIRTLAASHGIALPDPSAGDPVLRTALIALAVVVVLVVTSVGFVLAFG